jgi:muramidase (phage lysozyme)
MPTREQYQGYLQLPQVRAALDTIAWAEGGRSYQTLYGGGTFSGNQHPNMAITAGPYTSTAAGRYQFLYRTWIEIKNRLGLADFSGPNQDIAALDLISQRGQLGELLNGDFEGMMRRLGCAWAALPYATCGQTRRGLSETMNYYNSALSIYGGQPQQVNPAIVAAASSGGGSALSPVVIAFGVVALFLILDG